VAGLPVRATANLTTLSWQVIEAGSLGKVTAFPSTEPEALLSISWNGQYSCHSHKTLHGLVIQRH
jgi:hypothetical protein